VAVLAHLRDQDARATSLRLLEGEEIVDEVPTYRGEGRCFL